MRKVDDGKKKEKNVVFSGHYVIASSRPPKRWPLECRTLVPIWNYHYLVTTKICWNWINFCCTTIIQKVFCGWFRILIFRLSSCWCHLNFWGCLNFWGHFHSLVNLHFLVHLLYSLFIVVLSSFFVPSSFSWSSIVGVSSFLGRLHFWCLLQLSILSSMLPQYMALCVRLFHFVSCVQILFSPF